MSIWRVKLMNLGLIYKCTNFFELDQHLAGSLFSICGGVFMKSFL